MGSSFSEASQGGGDGRTSRPTSRAKYDHITADEEDESVERLENLTRPRLHPGSNYSFGSLILSLDGLDVFNYFKSKTSCLEGGMKLPEYQGRLQERIHIGESAQVCQCA